MNRIRVLLLIALFPVRMIAADASHEAITQFQRYLKSPIANRPPLTEQNFAYAPLMKSESVVAEQALWLDHVQRIKTERAAEMKDRILRDGKLEMPFFYEVFGQKPKTGRSLFISMHGGGGAPKAVNDQQWENQKHLYRPAEGVYLAPRAPTNNWNLWHEEHIDRLFARLIEDLIVFEDVDPNRVYIMGYSAGGDGVYQLAPRMADRLAAASMMAGHPNDASPLGLRNLPFAIHVGELDNGYNRNKVAGEWGKKLDDLRKDDPTGYEHVTKLHTGKAHWMDREDAEAVPWMAGHTRDPFPKKIVWKQASVVHSRFYWLAVPERDSKPGALVRASLVGQQITITGEDVSHVLLRLNDHLLDLNKPVLVLVGEKRVFEGTIPRTIASLAKTLNEEGDPTAVYSGELEVEIK